MSFGLGGIELAPLKVPLKVLLDGFKRDLKGAADAGVKAADDMAKRMQSALKVGGALEGIGSKLTLGVTLPLVGAGVASGKLASDFSKDMGMVSTLLDGTVSQVTTRTGELSDSVLSISDSVNIAADQVADGMYQVISAYGDSADSMAIMEIAAKGAKAGGAELTDTVNLLSAVTKGYGDTSSEANQKVSDLAFMTAKLGQTTFPELAGSLGKVVPLAQALGVSQEELFGVMATGTGVTGNAAEVVTQFRGILQSLMAPTDAMGALLEELGFASGKAMLETLGLQGTIDAVTKAAQTSGAPLQQYIGSIEGQTLALALSGAQHDVLTEKTAAMSRAAGATEEAFGRVAATTGEKLSGALNKAKNAVTRFGDVFAPVIEKAAELLGGFAKAISSLTPEGKKTVLLVGGIAAAIGPLLAVAGKGIQIFASLKIAFAGISAAVAAAGGGIAAIAGPIGIAVAAVAALAAAWATNFGGIRDKTMEAAESIRSIVGTVLDWLKTAWEEDFAFIRTVAEAAWESIQTIFDTALEIISGVLTALDAALKGDWDTVGESLKALGETIRKGLEEVLQTLGTALLEILSGVWDALTQWVSQQLESLSATFASWGEGIQRVWNNIWEAVGSFLAAVLNEISQGIASFGQAAQGAWEAAWLEIAGFCTSIVDTICKGVSELPHRIGVLIGETAAHFVTFMEKLTGFVTLEIPQIISGIILWFAQLPGKIGEQLAKVVQAVTKWGGDILAKGMETARGFLERVAAFFSQMPGELAAFFTEAVLTVIQWGKQTVDQGLEIGRQFMDSLVSFFSKIPGVVADWLSQTLQRIVQWGSDTKNKAVETGTNFLTSIVDYLSKLPGEFQQWFGGVIDYISDLPGRFFDMGADILTGLWEGMKSIGESLLGWLGDLWGSATSIFGDIADGIQEGWNNIRGADGSHAAGLDYVPFDGYNAVLHKGERVLTAEKNREYSRKDAGGGVVISKLADTIVMREEGDADRVATSLYRKFSRETRGRGLPST